MKKLITFLVIALFTHGVTKAQTVGTPTCNLSVSIDSNVVHPCFLGVMGGSCGCSNTLWAIVSGGTGPYSYSWTNNENASIWGTADTLKNACYVYWMIQVTDANGCVANAALNVVIPPPTPDTITIDTTAAVAGIAKYNSTFNLKLYPVPANNQLNITLNASINNARIEVYNVLGSKLLTQKVSDGVLTQTIDVSMLSEGNYFLKIVGDNGQKTAKFIINR